MRRVLESSGFTCIEVDDYAHAPAAGVPVVCFDEILNHVLDQWCRLEKHMSPFVLVESEPVCNLHNCWYRMRPALARGCNLVLTLNAANVHWWRTALHGEGLAHVAVAFWPQGSLPVSPDSGPLAHAPINGATDDGNGGASAAPTEGPSLWQLARFRPNDVPPDDHTVGDKVQDNADRDGDEARTLDVAMPGCTNSKDRVRTVDEIRKMGLVVHDGTTYGPDLDRLLATTRIFVYCPWGPHHRHFATQRLLWAIAAGACVVGVRSDDQEMEALYGRLYVSVDTMQDLAPKCRALIDSGEWISLGRQARARFRASDFDAVRLLSASEAMRTLSSLVLRRHS